MSRPVGPSSAISALVTPKRRTTSPHWRALNGSRGAVCRSSALSGSAGLSPAVPARAALVVLPVLRLLALVFLPLMGLLAPKLPVSLILFRLSFVVVLPGVLRV